MLRGVVIVGTMLALGTAAFAADGKAIYEKKCKLCHSIGGEGGPKKDLGGKLDGIGSKRDAAWLKAYFADPKSKIPNAKMPKLTMSDEDWNAVVEYMLSLK